MSMGNLFFWPFTAALVGAALIIAALLLAFWIWMIIDCAKRNFKNNIEKIIWILVIVLAHWFGSLVYFIVIKIYNPKGLVENNIKSKEDRKVKKRR